LGNYEVVYSKMGPVVFAGGAVNKFEPLGAPVPIQSSTSRATGAAAWLDFESMKFSLPKANGKFPSEKRCPTYNPLHFVEMLLKLFACQQHLGCESGCVCSFSVIALPFCVSRLDILPGYCVSCFE